jgi:hypothetical protein
LISTQLGSGYVSLMQNTTTTTIDDSAQNWKLVENSPVSASTAPTVATSPPAAASSTPAELSTPATATASYLSSFTTTATTLSTNFASISSIPSTSSTTTVLTSPSTSASGPSSSPGNSTSQPGGQPQNTLSVGDKAGIISSVCAVIMLLIAFFALPASLLRIISCGCYPRRNIDNQQMRGNIRISLHIR